MLLIDITSMQEYTITLRAKKDIAQNTMQYDFDKPKDFTFRAGQFAILDMPHPVHRDERPSFRSLSIASAPHEEILSFIMRNSQSAFKQNMLALHTGDAVTMKAPLGHMALPEDESVPVVFLAAGVGITPVRSMLRHAEQEQLKNPITLFYANRQKATAACLDEVMQCAVENYTCLAVMSRPTPQWTGLRGRINKEMIKDHVSDFVQTQFYVIGTTGFVGAMKEILQDLDVADHQLHIDNFG